MSLLEKLGLTMLHRLDPERAHGLALRALHAGLVPLRGAVTSERLTTTLAGLTLPNPIGLAAGFDKNATALHPLSRSGFGFIELGAATPLPQPGNPKPRLFRLKEERAVINRFGFNNAGAEVIAKRLAKRPKDAVIGLNLGANKTSHDRARDFAKVLRVTGAWLDFATVNVSSPNTEALRDLQGKAALLQILQDVMEARASLPNPVAIFVKIAPDLDQAALFEIAEAAKMAGVDGIIATNTTLDRTGLTSRHAHEAGGLSGAPLMARSTRILAQLSAAIEGEIPLIGVGGVACAKDALEKIRAGASAVQLYSALVYEGMSLAQRIPQEIDAYLAREGIAHISELIGAQRSRFLQA